MRPAASLFLVAALSNASPAEAQQAPPSTLGDLLREATPKERKTIENVAKRLYPSSRPEIDKLVDRIEDEEKAQVGRQRFAQGWSGEGSLGASVSSGNTSEWSASASLDIQRKGPRWKHNFGFDIDLKQSEGDRTAEQWSTQYRARRDISHSPWFAFASIHYEHDRLQGIERRFTETVGAGYQLIDRDELELELSSGPALRQTRFYDQADENRIAAFIGTELKWEITDTLTFKGKAGAVLDSDSSTLSSSTSLTTNIYGRLSGRLSFDVDVETRPPEGKRKVDTETSMSLVLGF